MSFSFGATPAAAPAASSGFSFGSVATTTTAAPSTGGGFSFGASVAPAAAPATSGGFSFGGSAAPAPATSSGFSFGGASSTPAASTGFSFGGASAAPAAATGTTTTSSGGFSFGGASTTAAPAPASSGGFSFGAGASTATTAAPASSGGFSFGGSTAPATSTGTTTGLFGNSTGSTGLFGGSTSTGSSLFGGAAAAKPTGSLFGSATTTTPGSTLGGFGGFGATTAQPAAAPQPAITLETVFDSLPADVKKNITEFHKFLKEEDQSDAFLKSVSARKLDDLKANLEQLEQDVLVRRNLQDRQATAVHHVHKDVKHLINQVDTATLNLRSMSGESTSQRFYGIMRRVEMPSPYYWELLDSFEARMEQIKAQIESVESEFRPLYEKQRRGEGGNSSAVDPSMLHQILIAQNTALIQVAAHVAEVHEKTEEMRQVFIRKMKEDMLKHGEKNLAGFKNPFDKKKKSATRESDIDNIRFKTSVVPTIVQQPQLAQAAPSTTGFGFGSGATGATTAGGFGSTSSFGSTTTGSSLFGAKPTISTVSTAAPAASGSGFSFSSTPAPASTAPKQVSFSLGGSTASTALTSTTSTAPTATSAFGFSTPAPAADSSASTGAFGSVSSSFMPAGTPAFGAAAGDKRAGSSTAAKSGGLRTRQKKR